MTFVPSLFPIAQTVVSGTAASIVFSNLPTRYRHLSLLINARGNDGGNTTSNVLIQFNGDTTAAHYDTCDTYSAQNIGSNSDTLPAFGSIIIYTIPAGLAAASRGAPVEVWILDYNNTTFMKNVFAMSMVTWNDIDNSIQRRNNGGVWLSTSPITSITLSLGIGSFIAGSSAVLYGQV